MQEVLAFLQDSPPIAALRGSRWVYPGVNAAHIAGIALLFGGILPFDLRLIGFWPRVPLDHLRRVLVPVATVGLVLAIGAGALLFAVHAPKYAATPLFQVKLVLIVLAILNAVAMRRAPAWRLAGAIASYGTAASLRFGAIVSIVLWLSVIICGRMLAYI